MPTPGAGEGARAVVDALWTEFHVYDDHAVDGFGDPREACVEETCQRLRAFLVEGRPFVRDEFADRASRRKRREPYDSGETIIYPPGGEEFAVCSEYEQALIREVIRLRAENRAAHARGRAEGIEAAAGVAEQYEAPWRTEHPRESFLSDLEAVILTALLNFDRSDDGQPERNIAEAVLRFIQGEQQAWPTEGSASQAIRALPGAAEGRT